jgi:hypothetical protein
MKRKSDWEKAVKIINAVEKIVKKLDYENLCALKTLINSCMLTRIDELEKDKHDK